MASSLTAAAASVTKTTSASPYPFIQCHCSHSKVSFTLSFKSKLRFSTKALRSNWKHSTLVKAQLDEVAAEGSSNAVKTPATESEVQELEEKNAKLLNEPSPAASASEESISEFLTQVASLVKLVDSRDIVELQLKQLDCEIIIRKKDALPQAPSPAPVVIMHSPSSPAVMPSAYQHVPTATGPAPSAPVSSSASTPAPSPPAAKSAKSSLQPLKCPMAGTFYRNPGPGEPPFVKVILLY
ncbi:hypothetical protein HHK36_027206 [Tetracentron sinense]|uniref:Biotin carboxyl carrier protein of acetyl-CoA carboxylase n=1 Tax=Tetracentron sinense TaxID=13715 RepID=A0A835D3C2_TETSI|nr:hypothetical protein HHK36_027206 [Tetracentron sinense]